MDMKQIEAMAKEYKEWKRMEEEAKTAQDELKAKLIEAMEGKDQVIAGPFKISNKMVSQTRFDTAAFKKDEPKLAELYSNTATFPRFQIS